MMIQNNSGGKPVLLKKEATPKGRWKLAYLSSGCTKGNNGKHPEIFYICKFIMQI